MTNFSLWTLSFMLYSLNQAASEVCYITTNSTDACSVQPCLTFSHFAASSSQYIHSNATLVFLPGTHYLSSVNLTLSNVDIFVMKSENSTAQIQCTNDSRMYFNQSSCIHITNLEFIGCGGNLVKYVEEFVVEDTKFEGQENSGTALELIETTARIFNSTFVSNRKGSYRKCVLVHDLHYGEFYYTDAFIGGAIIASNSSVDISQSKVESNNAATFGGAIFAEQYSIINMSDSVFVNNDAFYGGVLYSNYSIIIVKASEFHRTIGGVLYSYCSTITIGASKFHDNYGVLASFNSSIAIEASEFHDNSAVLDSNSDTITMNASEFCSNIAGVLKSHSSNITIVANSFHDNRGTYIGGILYFKSSTITIETSGFHYNSARDGGVMYSDSCTILMEASEFHNNSAWLGGSGGGVLYLWNSHNITIETSKFHGNSANNGGVLYSDSSSITIEASDFHNNSATYLGGVLYSESSSIAMGDSNFTKNSSPVGAVISAIDNSKICHHSYVLINKNLAVRYAVIHLFDSEFRGCDSDMHNVITISNNLGSLLAFKSMITLICYAELVNNQARQMNIGDFQEGGAITLIQSSVIFDGTCNLETNHAENGGAIHSTESKLYLNGNVTISHNTASKNGGGVYLSSSELNCQQNSTFVLFNNTASKGGGLHAISSSIKAISSLLSNRYNYPTYYTGARINFTGNTAKRGGGLSLEANAKLYILKYHTLSQLIEHVLDSNTTVFTANSAADYGGAVYIDDDTNSGTCASDTKSECFIQVLAIYGQQGNNPKVKVQSIYFSHNIANISGSTLYGGLLDRCAVSQFAEIYKKYPLEYGDTSDGIFYFKNISIPTYYTRDETEKAISIITNISVSSLPVRVCICISDEGHCTHQSYTEVKKGHTFTRSLVAVDQIGQPVGAIIRTALQFTESGLAEGQLARKIPAECTNLTFNVVSPYDSENLTLHASDGPCKDADLSTATVQIQFLPCSCPIGLQVTGINSTNCTCECHKDIRQYVQQCDSHNGLLVKQPQSRAWISYINDTDLTGYLVYPNCPFDYCLSTSPPVDLNQPNGADAQCAFNRSSLNLCGTCRPSLSLSLGSSHCLSCPGHWPALLIVITIAAILAGIALVALLLVLNMTVAVGTLNGLIFYANVVYANKSILLPFQKTNFITIFISWLNLELGIDTCYFPGMDTYIKTWLQLAFPAYVILLVVLVINISSYSTRFSNLIGKKKPVETLATLILLSYAKLIEICFKSLSVGSLEYPDGSSAMLWLPDATIKYLSGKHIPLFIAAVLILLVGLVYTALLFLWQWLLYLPRWRIFRWSRNPKIQTFIETYHIPYTLKHRYWTGLLLIVRTVSYLVAAVNVSNNPATALTAISISVCCIVAFSKFFGRSLYRTWPVDALEIFFYLNILSFVIFTWYSLDNQDSNQEAAAYTSVTLTFIALLLIVLYHVYTYTNVFSKVKKTKLIDRMINQLFTESDAGPKPKPQQYRVIPQRDVDIHELLATNEQDYPIYADDHNRIGIPQLEPTVPVKPTQTVLELPIPSDLREPILKK